MTVRVGAFHCTLVGKHVPSGEGVLGSNPNSPKFCTKRFPRTLATSEECFLKETSYTVHYTVFRGYLQCVKLL